MPAARLLIGLVVLLGLALPAFRPPAKPQDHPPSRLHPPALPRPAPMAADWYRGLPASLRRDPTPARFLPAIRFRDRALGSRVPGGYVFWKTVRAKVTAYDPSERCCGDSADGFTSLNDNAWVMDGVAVDPRAIPYRCVLDIPEVGLREADDTGSAMAHSWDAGEFHIDVRMPYYYEARLWGVKYLDVKVYRPEMP